MAEHVLGAAGAANGALGAVANPGESSEALLHVAGVDRIGDPTGGVGERLARRFELPGERGLGVALGRAQLSRKCPKGRPPSLDGGAELGLAGRDRLGPGPEPLVRGPQRRQVGPHRGALPVALGEPVLNGGAALARFLDQRFHPVTLRPRLERGLLSHREIAVADGEPVPEELKLQLHRLPLEAGVGLGGVGLRPQGAQTRTRLALDVEGAVEVLPRPLELELRATAALAVLAEPRGLLDQQAPLARLGEDDRLDLALSDHRVHLTAEGGVRERVGDVGETAAGTVEAVATIAGAIERAGNGDLRELGSGRAVEVVDDDLDLGGAPGGALAAAGEDHVLHALAAHRQRALLAERPEHSVGDVRLPGAVRPDDHADAGRELELGALGKGLEALQRDRLQMQALVSGR